jgi:hypothetical protein
MLLRKTFWGVIERKDGSWVIGWWGRVRREMRRKSQIDVELDMSS